MDATWSPTSSPRKQQSNISTAAQAHTKFAGTVQNHINDLVAKRLQPYCPLLGLNMALRVQRWHAQSVCQLKIKLPLLMDLCAVQDTDSAADFLQHFQALPRRLRSSLIVHLTWSIWNGLPKTRADCINAVQWDWILDRLNDYLLSGQHHAMNCLPARQILDFPAFFDRMWGLTARHCTTSTFWECALFLQHCHNVIFQSTSYAVDWEVFEAIAPVPAANVQVAGAVEAASHALSECSSPSLPPSESNFREDDIPMTLSAAEDATEVSETTAEETSENESLHAEQPTNAGKGARRRISRRVHADVQLQFTLRRKRSVRMRKRATVSTPTTRITSPTSGERGPRACTAPAASGFAKPLEGTKPTNQLAESPRHSLDAGLTPKARPKLLPALHQSKKRINAPELVLPVSQITLEPPDAPCLTSPSPLRSNPWRGSKPDCSLFDPTRLSPAGPRAVQTVPSVLPAQRRLGHLQPPEPSPRSPVLHDGRLSPRDGRLTPQDSSLLSPHQLSAGMLSAFQLSPRRRRSLSSSSQGGTSSASSAMNSRQGTSTFTTDLSTSLSMSLRSLPFEDNPAFAEEELQEEGGHSVWRVEVEPCTATSSYLSEDRFLMPSKRRLASIRSLTLQLPNQNAADGEPLSSRRQSPRVSLSSPLIFEDLENQTTFDPQSPTKLSQGKCHKEAGTNAESLGNPLQPFEMDGEAVTHTSMLLLRRRRASLSPINNGKK